MKNIYNKGAYRGGEWGKHLRPYGKRTGNKKFRKSAENEIKEQLSDSSKMRSLKIRDKTAKLIIVRYTLTYFSDIKRTKTAKYKKLKGALNSVNRPNVSACFFLNEPG